MKESKHTSVQRLARKSGSGFVGDLLGRRFGPGRLTIAAIHRISGKRMPDMRKVHPNLMRAPGLEPAIEQ